MRKILTLFFLTLFAVQVMGIAALVFGDDCAVECSAEHSGSTTPPCTSCHCCFASQVFMPASVTVLDLRCPAEATSDASDARRARSTSVDIFHVPKSLIA